MDGGRDRERKERKEKREREKEEEGNEQMRKGIEGEIQVVVIL